MYVVDKFIRDYSKKSTSDSDPDKARLLRERRSTFRKLRVLIDAGLGDLDRLSADDRDALQIS